MQQEGDSPQSDSSEQTSATAAGLLYGANSDFHDYY